MERPLLFSFSRHFCVNITAFLHTVRSGNNTRIILWLHNELNKDLEEVYFLRFSFILKEYIYGTGSRNTIDNKTIN